MTKTNKKILAREVLILFSTALLIGIVALGYRLYSDNFVTENINETMKFIEKTTIHLRYQSRNIICGIIILIYPIRLIYYTTK